MLTFNLKNSDRQDLRRRIGIGLLGATELSGMSNADLASEQLKKEMETAHQESLQHSILEGRSVDRPLRKMTHKGEEEIEDLRKTDTSGWAARTASDSLPRIDVSRRRHSRSISQSETPVMEPDSAGHESFPLSSTSENFDSPSQLLTLPLSPDSSTFPEAPNTDFTNDPGFAQVESPSSSRFNLNDLSWAQGAQEGAPELPTEEAGGSPLLGPQDDQMEVLDDAQSSEHDFGQFLDPDDEGNGEGPAAPPAYVPQPPIWSGEVSST